MDEVGYYAPFEDLRKLKTRMLPEPHGGRGIFYSDLLDLKDMENNNSPREKRRTTTPGDKKKKKKRTSPRERREEENNGLWTFITVPLDYPTFCYDSV